MSLWELFVIAVGLSMDATAVAICKGLSAPKIRLRHSIWTGLWFGGFQGLMPLIGWLVGSQFQSVIERFDHWIAFVLLGFLGFNMIRESREEECVNCSFTAKAMFPMALATSIDALAVGVTFAFLRVDIVPAVSFIAVITFLLSALGVRLGSVLGQKYQKWAQISGGIILILMGLKILLEHLGVIG